MMTKATRLELARALVTAGYTREELQTKLRAVLDAGTGTGKISSWADIGLNVSYDHAADFSPLELVNVLRYAITLLDGNAVPVCPQPQIKRIFL